MIDQINDALRALLLRELAVNGNEIEIVYDRPTREWSTRAGNRPTINIFLHDIRENNKLRGQQPVFNVEKNGPMARLSRQPLKVDLHYMITAWTREPADEHRLLTAILMVLFRYGELPATLLREHLDNQPEYGASLKVAQYETHVNPRDLWSVLDNELRPGIDLVVTIPLEPHREIELPLVREVEITYHQIVNTERTNGSYER